MARHDHKIDISAAFSIAPEDLLRRPMQGVSLRALGRLPFGDMPRVAVIGARRAGPAQLAMARTLAGALCEAGAVVVSGGAIGVGAAAHQGAMDCGGATVAVLPGGLARPSPVRHDQLFADIAERRGMLLSPFADLEPASRASFHARNQLIAHLIDALITVCADPRSGSLHCANRALRAGVPVFAVPWSPGTANSEGSNGLLAGHASAIWHRDGVAALIETLSKGTGADGGAGASVTRSSRRQRPSAASTSGGGDGATIDAGRRGRQICAPLEPPRGRAFEPPPGAEPGLVTALDALLAADEALGITLEEAAGALTRPRGEVAAALLALGMSGQIRKGIGGRYRRSR